MTKIKKTQLVPRESNEKTRLRHEGMPFARVALAKAKTLVALLLDESMKPKVILSALENKIFHS